MAKRPRLNRGQLVVYFPDGCRLEYTIRPEGPAARSATAFGNWLVKTGEEIIECATTQGQCAEPLRTEGDQMAETPLFWNWRARLRSWLRVTIGTHYRCRCGADVDVRYRVQHEGFHDAFRDFCRPPTVEEMRAARLPAKGSGS